MDNDILSLIQSTSSVASQVDLFEVCSKQSFQAYFELYCDYKEKIRNGELGITAQFWLNYMDKIWIVLRCLRATKTNDFDLHLATIEQMCPLYFAYDHQNCARYLSTYLLSMLNISSSHPGAEKLLRNNGFSVSRSDVPGCRNAVDMTIEQTINRHAKSAGGIIGFSRNISAYYRWCVTRHSRAAYVEATYDMANMSHSDTSINHKEMRPHNIKNSERDVQKVREAFSNFTNPFTIEDKEELFCLSSGVPASPDVTRDLQSAEAVGQQCFKEFIQSRFVEKTILFHDPIKRKKHLHPWGRARKLQHLKIKL